VKNLSPNKRRERILRLWGEPWKAQRVKVVKAFVFGGVWFGVQKKEKKGPEFSRQSICAFGAKVSSKKKKKGREQPEKHTKAEVIWNAREGGGVRF